MQTNKMNISHRLKKMSVMISVAVLFIAAAGKAATVGYWRFELSPVSQYNSPTLDITLSGASQYSPKIPGVQITDGSTTYSNVASYLHGTGNTSPSTISNYSVINAGMSGTQFTVEAFVNLKTGAVHDWDFIVGNYLAATPTSNSTGWYFDIEPGGKIGFLGCQTFAGQSPAIAKSATVLSEGVWHHVAAVGKRVNTQQMQVQMYIDYVADGAPVNIWSALDSGPYIKVNNGVYKFGEINPFDGNFDEVRISDTALSPSQFLRVVYEPVAYWRFENSLSSEYNSSVLELIQGSTATFSTTVPSGTIFDDTTSRNNTASYNHGTGSESYTNDYAVINSAVSSDFTIEAFVNLTPGADNKWDLIIGNSQTGYGCAFNIESGDKLGFDAYQVFDSAHKVATSATVLSKGVWHHVAAVGKMVGAQYMDVQLYVDYVASGASIRLWGNNVIGPCIKVNAYGYGVGSPNPFDGLIDELRVTKGALPPEKFLKISGVPTNCSQVWQFGYGMGTDLNKDCKVDMSDLKIFVADWLSCNDPAGCN